MVREIFATYLREQSLTRAVEHLERRGWRRKSWTRRDGRVQEGSPFNKVGLIRLLKNPLYVGRVPHRGTLHQGQQPAIVDEVVWTRVQEPLRLSGSSGGRSVRNKHGALLRGLLRCAQCGHSMNHTYTTKKNGARYRYYRCATNEKRGAFACPGGSVSAQEVERLVVERIRGIGLDPELVSEVVRQARVQLDQHRHALEAEQRQLGKDLKRERASVRRLTGAESRNGNASRLAAVQKRVEAIERRLAAVAQELDTARRQVIDEGRVTEALAAFGPVWEALLPSERARMLSLTTERIVYDGGTRELDVTLRPSGIGRLHEL